MIARAIVRSIKNYKINVVIKILIVSDFIIWSSYNLLAPIFAIFISEQVPGASLETVGIATGLYLLVKSLAEVPVGIFIDKTKSENDDYYTMVFGTILSAAAYVLYVFIDAVWQLYALQIFLGLGAAIAYPGWYSIFTKHIDKRRAAFEWSIYDVLLGTGMALSAFVGAFFADYFGFDVLFIVIGIMTLAGAFLLFFIKDKIYLK